MAVPLDEYPIHQVPLSMRYVATSDRNVYDRCIFQAHDRTGDVLLITGLGVYPNLGVIDAYASVRRGDTQRTVRLSDALGDDRMIQEVGPYRIEVVDPLRELRVVCDAAEHGIELDLTFEATAPPIDEPHHLHRMGDKVLLDASRFAQVGAWRGTLRVDGDDIPISPDRWVATRDRSWGIRPVGEAEPAGRVAEEHPTEGFWWVWMPMRFEDHALMVIVQEDPDGHRILNEAVRVWPESTGKRPEQLGWPEIDIEYRPGTRYPERATVHLTERGRKPLEVEVRCHGSMALNVGCGYGGDPEWSHGQWRGRGWIEGVVHDYGDAAVSGRAAFSVIDHIGQATIDGAEGWGIFEHASFGRHDPSGMADWSSVALG